MKLVATLLFMMSCLFATVDINNASSQELSSLKGIGEKKAEAIVAYRKIHCFKSVQDIVQVKGIGEKFLQKNAKNLTAGSCKK